MEKIKRILISEKGKAFYVRDLNQDFHTKSGFFRKKDLAKKQGKILSSSKEKYSIIEPLFIDSYKRIKRGPQLIMPKDIGIIIAETGINKAAKVLDLGGGSGALACFLANISKEVVTYEINRDFANIIELNKKFLGIKNLTIKNQDAYKKLDEKDIDLITVDLPEPWNIIENSAKSLKSGGFLACYLPNITQVSRLVSEIKKSKSFAYLKTIELIKREWRIDESIARPEFNMLGHTGFLVFVRKV